MFLEKSGITKLFPSLGSRSGDIKQVKTNSIKAITNILSRSNLFAAEIGKFKTEEVEKLTRDQWVKKCSGFEKSGELIVNIEGIFKEIKLINQIPLEQLTEENKAAKSNRIIFLNVALGELEKRARENPEKFYNDLKEYYGAQETEEVLRKINDLFLRLAAVSDEDPYIINICRKILGSIAQPNTEVKIKEKEEVIENDMPGANNEEWKKNAQKISASNLLVCMENYLLQIKPRIANPTHEDKKIISRCGKKLEIIFLELTRRAQDNLPKLREELNLVRGKKDNFTRMFELVLQAYEIIGEADYRVINACDGFIALFCVSDKWEYTNCEKIADNLSKSWDIMKLVQETERRLANESWKITPAIKNIRKAEEHISDYETSLFKELKKRVETEPLKLYRELNEKDAFIKLFQVILATYDYNSSLSAKAIKERDEFVEKFSYNIECCEGGLKKLSVENLYQHLVGALNIIPVVHPMTPSADRNILNGRIKKILNKSAEFAFAELNARCADDPFKMEKDMDSENLGLDKVSRLIANMPDFKGVSEQVVEASKAFVLEAGVKMRAGINKGTDEDKRLQENYDKIKRLREQINKLDDECVKAEDEGRTEDVKKLKGRIEVRINQIKNLNADCTDILKETNDISYEKGKTYGEFVGALYGALISKYSSGKAWEVLREILKVEAEFSVKTGGGKSGGKAPEGEAAPAGGAGIIPSGSLSIKTDLIKLIDKIIGVVKDEKINNFLNKTSLAYPLAKVDLPQYKEDDFCRGFYKGFKNYYETFIKNMTPPAKSKEKGSEKSE